MFDNIEMIKSENVKSDSNQSEAGNGESDVWRIIQSRTPEPLPNSEAYNQDKENVNISSKNFNFQKF